MLPDRVSNPGPLTYESGALSIALRGPWDLHLNKLDHQAMLRNIFQVHEPRSYGEEDFFSKYHF